WLSVRSRRRSRSRGNLSLLLFGVLLGPLRRLGPLLWLGECLSLFILLLSCARRAFPQGLPVALRTAGANFAWCNRQIITHAVREAWRRILGPDEELAVAAAQAWRCCATRRKALRHRSDRPKLAD